MNNPNHGAGSADLNDYVLATRSRQPSVFEDILGDQSGMNTNRLGSVVKVPSCSGYGNRTAISLPTADRDFAALPHVGKSYRYVVGANGAADGSVLTELARGANPHVFQTDMPTKQGKVHEIDETPGTLFFLYLYMSGTIYGSMLLLSSGAFLFGFFYTGYFESERERDFFQIAMLGFSAMFGWVLLSMWISFKEKNYGWAFISSLPSLVIIALVVIVITTGDCCDKPRFASRSIYGYPTLAPVAAPVTMAPYTMHPTTAPPSSYYAYYAEDP